MDSLDPTLAWLTDLPKAELHVHLEGSIDVPGLLAIDPSLTEAEARAGFAYTDFPGFLQSFAFVAKRLKEPAHYAIAARRLFENLIAQHVTYAEVILSAGVVLWKQQNFADVFEAVEAEAKRVEASLQVAWNLDAVRQWGPQKAMEVIEAIRPYAGRTGISFGLGGDEAGGPARDFKQVFSQAKAAGFRLTCHAGETTGPESVWQAIEAGAERIGHGIGAIDEPALVRYLADMRIPLEISITSNVRTGAVESLADHPVRRLFDAGVPIILNTDDPGLFDVNLVGEYALAARQFGFAESELRVIIANGFAFAFAKEPRKQVG